MVDPSTIHPGSTRREEVLHDWAWSDAHVGSNDLFVGRMRRSTYRELSIPFDAEREWKIQNMFVEFDQSGVVSKTYFVSDSHLAGEAAAWAARVPQPLLDLSKPIEVPSEHFGIRRCKSKGGQPGTFVLRSDGLDVRCSTGSAAIFHFTPQQLVRFHHCRGFHYSWGLCLQVSGDSYGVSNLNFSLGVPELFTLVRFLHQVAPAAIAGDSVSNTPPNQVH